MSSHNWANSPPPSSRQPDFRLQSTSSGGRPYNSHAVNFFENQYSLYTPGPMFNPYASTTADPRARLSQPSTNFSSMNSRALVAAALAPPSTPVEPESDVRDTSNRASRALRSDTQTRPDIGASSSPLSEPPEIDITSGSDRDTHEPVINKRSHQSRKRSHSEILDADNDHEEDSSRKTRENPNRLRRTRSAKGKRSLRQRESSDEEAVVLPTPPKKIVRKKNVTKRLIRKKPQGTKVPETLDDANEADRMMWFWKNSGKEWDEIRIEWARLTGVKPGKSSLSVRYIKLNENFARNGAGGHLELIKYRNEAMEELMAGLWDKVAEKMLAFNPLSEHNPKDLKRRYEHLERSGFDIAKVLAREASGEQEQEEDNAHIDEDASDKDLFGLTQPSTQEAFAATTYPSTATPPDTTFDATALPDSTFTTDQFPGANFSLTQDMEMFDPGSLMNFNANYHATSLKERGSDATRVNNITDAKRFSSRRFMSQSANVRASATSTSVSNNSGLVAYESESD